MDALTGGRQVAINNFAGNPVAAYVAGYADGASVLHSDGCDRASAEPLGGSYARYLCYIEQEPATSEALAYLAGFRAAAAGNLPCPPAECTAPNRRVAA